MKKEIKENWEKEETIKNIRYYCDILWNAGLSKKGEKLVEYKNKIEEEIRQLLKSEKQNWQKELVEKIKKMKKWKLVNMPNLQKMETFNYEAEVYNQTIDDILKLLKEK